MEDQAGENMDGSSIKPVSSLRSHFELMAKSTQKVTTAPPRPISPKPPVSGALSSAKASAGTANLRSPSLMPDPSASLMRPLGPLRQISEPNPASHLFISPSVIVDPPKSPPRILNLNLTLASTSAHLSADSSRASSTSPMLIPRQYRKPNTPRTASPEPKKVSKTPATGPPEPPPPRRSGELRREGISKAPVGLAPPVNRAEKPKVAVNKSLLGHNLDDFGLTSSNLQSVKEKASPFSTPPSSDSSQGFENEQPFVVMPNPIGTHQIVRSRTPVLTFDPPPIHHSLQSLRRDQDFHGQGRTNSSSQAAIEMHEQRPALPVRPTTTSSPSSTRNSMDTHRPLIHSNASSDMLISCKSSSTLARATEGDFSVPTLPKRNFSSPTTQILTPPRAHGRSMTVDQTSHRIQAETGLSGKFAPKRTETLERSNTTKPMTTGALKSSDLPEYPDSSFSNRRPPHNDQGPAEIYTKYDTRIFDACGGYLCTSGHHTQVWSLYDGEQIMSIPHAEATKILAVAFKAASDPNDEGSRVWLGNNIGEIIEIDVSPESEKIATNYSAHNRREIIKIYRHMSEMWTLDESGTLHIWASNSTGSPNLEDPSVTHRLPKGHTFSILVKDELWYTTGNEIRVFAPSVDPRVQFKRNQEPMQQQGTGEITSGAVISDRDGRVYFGHADGKVSIYSSSHYCCYGIVNVSMYKINSLAGAGDYLWAAYNTGVIQIYDTTCVPWVVKKDWRAHGNPVITILADRSSFWTLNRLQVISLGADNALRIWDGLLREDWLETQLQSQEERFCEFEQIKALVMTWNAGASTPHSLRFADDDKNFFPNLLKESSLPDIIVFGFQELVDLEDKKAAAKSFFSKSKKKDPSEHEHMRRQYKEWSDYLIRCLDDTMPRHELYHMLHSASLVGLFTCVLVRAHLRDRIRDVSVAEVKRGLGGRAGNKGALILRFIVDDTSMCLINCHLAAGQNQTKDRNFDISSILDSTLLPVEKHASVRLNTYIGGGDGSMILDHEICILNGDLNYRIDTMPRDAILGALRKGEMGKLLERDQLLASRRKRPGFRLRAFYEMPITFAPTYKYDVGTDNYDTSEKKRTPAWCDRILYRGRDHKRLKQVDYRRHEVRVSDHRPVSGLFHVTIKKISPSKRDMTWEECRRNFEELKFKVGNSARLDFLQNVCSIDSESGRRLLDQRNHKHGYR